MRILHLLHQYLPEYVGGTELYTHWLSQRLNQRGHENIIFHRRSGEGAGVEQWTDEAGVQIWAAWSGSMTPERRFQAVLGEPKITQAFDRVLHESKPELVHIQHLMGLPPALVDRLQQSNLPYIITLHDYWWGCANAQLLTNDRQQLCLGPQAYFNCGSCALARAGRSHFWPALPALAGLLAWRNRRLRRILHKSRRLIAPTQFVADWYVRQGAASERVAVIPHGLDAPPQPVRPPRSADEPIRFAYIGGLSWQKGIHVVVQAFKELGAAAELWIAGDESADPAYAASLRAQASPQVHFLGRLSRTEVWAHLAQIDVVVVPSLWYETFSIIVSEAFAAGVPVLASQVGVLAERVRHGCDGLLAAPGDEKAWQQALQQFCQDRTLLPRLRANIRPGWTLAEHVQAIEKLYFDLTLHV